MAEEHVVSRSNVYYQIERIQMWQQRCSVSVWWWFQDPADFRFCHHALSAHITTTHMATISRFSCQLFFCIIVLSDRAGTVRVFLLKSCVIGCNNGIWGFHINFKRSKLPDFQWAQKMRHKNCSCWVQQKNWQVRALLYKTPKWRKIPTDSAVTEPK